MPQGCTCILYLIKTFFFRYAQITRQLVKKENTHCKYVTVHNKLTITAQGHNLGYGPSHLSIEEAFLHKNLLRNFQNAVLKCTSLNMARKSWQCSYIDYPCYRAIAIVTAIGKNISSNLQSLYTNYHRKCLLFFFMK